MRIVINGQQAFGKAVLERLLERGEDVVAVFGPEDADGRPPDPLVQAARDRGLAHFQPSSFRTDEAAGLLRSLAPDLGVMAFVTKYVPSSFLDVPRHGTIQYHPSLLPIHRGPSSVNWPIIQGKAETGLTIFWPDDGLDTGPVLLQKAVAIGPDDTLGSVYFDKLFPLGVDAMVEAIDLVRDGQAPRVEQDESKATYESWCRSEDARIDWERPAAEVYDLIRGTNPQPGAWTTLDGAKVSIFDSRRGDDAEGAAGTLVAIGEGGLEIAAGGGSIAVSRVRVDWGGKIPAVELAELFGLEVGARFGT
jgi:methionyl-tRNA formyltransferase